ncbi:hypothetical protein [Magnetococcus sp. PR-3]|uniref:hypothetical protein n=1 Tax=Magnetococcus sp. PR-3 TaxID=3120355 RepID=UPI002FCE5C75
MTTLSQVVSLSQSYYTLTQGTDESTSRLTELEDYNSESQGISVMDSSFSYESFSALDTDGDFFITSSDLASITASFNSTPLSLLQQTLDLESSPTNDLLALTAYGKAASSLSTDPVTSQLLAQANALQYSTLFNDSNALNRTVSTITSLLDTTA